MESQGRRRLLPTSAWSLPGQCVGKNCPRVGDKSQHCHMLGGTCGPYFARPIWRDLVCFFSPRRSGLFLLGWEPLPPKADARESSVVLTGLRTARCCPGLVRRWGLELTVPLNGEARMHREKLPIPGLLCTRHCVCMLEKKKTGSWSPLHLGRDEE